MNTQKRYRPGQKVEILRELLENQVSVSELSKRYGVSSGVIYRWKKQLFQGAIEIFKQKGRVGRVMATKVEKLEEKVKQRDELISEIVADNIRLKKSLNGES